MERMSLLDGKRLQSAPTEVRMRPHRVELPSTLAHLPFLGAERFGHGDWVGALVEQGEQLVHGGDGVAGHAVTASGDGRSEDRVTDEQPDQPEVEEEVGRERPTDDEMARVFNLGIGMCAVGPASDSTAGTVIGRLV